VSLRELQQRVADYLHEKHEALNASRRRKLEQAHEMFEHLDVYDALLESLVSIESRFQPARA
jgi:hypothetical protein